MAVGGREGETKLKKKLTPLVFLYRNLSLGVVGKEFILGRFHGWLKIAQFL